MTSIPSEYPRYITNIADVKERTRWQNRYLVAYAEEVKQVNKEWNSLKAAMYGVASLALVTFLTIMMATAPLSMPFVVASCLTIASVGLTASACTISYFATLGCQNDTNIRELPYKFPIKFENEFNKTLLQEGMIGLISDGKQLAVSAIRGNTEEELSKSYQEYYNKWEGKIQRASGSEATELRKEYDEVYKDWQAKVQAIRNQRANR